MDKYVFSSFYPMKGIHILLLFVSSFCLGCHFESPNLESEQGLGSNDEKGMWRLDTFSNMPPEIDGCACYFSRDSIDFSKRAYIYVNDFAKFSFVMLNGELLEFVQTEFVKDGSMTQVKARTGKYEMHLDLFNREMIKGEADIKVGTLVIMNQQGQQMKWMLYGACGC